MKKFLVLLAVLVAVALFTTALPEAVLAQEIVFTATPMATDTETPQETGIPSPTTTPTPTPKPSHSDWSVEFDQADYLFCQIEPGWVQASGTVFLPKGVSAKLQLAWWIVEPKDLRTEQVYIDAGVVEDGHRFSFEAWWPGIRPGDSLVEIHWGAALLDSQSGNPIGRNDGLDAYWRTGHCTVTPVPPTPTPTETPPTEPTPGPTKTPEPTPIETETPRTPTETSESTSTPILVPAASVGNSVSEVVSETGDWVKVGRKFLSVHQECNTNDNNVLQLPDTGAALCNGSVYLHRIQEGWISLEEGIVVILKVGSNISTFKLEQKGTLGYQNSLPGAGYIGSCYGNESGWLGIELFRLVPVFEDPQRNPQ
jgi:hypothetical protein